MLNANQARFLRLIVWVEVPQLLLVAGLYLLYTLLAAGQVGGADLSNNLIQNLSSILAGGLVYGMAFAVYGLVYFANRGAAASGKIVGGLILAVVFKYILVVVGSMIAMTYFPLNTLPFFATLLANHLLYLIANPLYMSKHL